MEDKFSSKVNKVYQEITEIQNPQEKSDLIKKITILVWNELNISWSRKYDIESYTVEITECIQNCIRNFSIDYNKPFSNYLFAALKHQLQKAIRAENQAAFQNVSIYTNDDDGNEILLTDFLPSLQISKQEHSFEDQFIALEQFKNDLKFFQNAVECEKENKEIKSALLTQQILYILEKYKFINLSEKEIKQIKKDFSFINKNIWDSFFYKNELPTQEMVAAAFCCKKSNACKMMTRFLERIKEHILN